MALTLWHPKSPSELIKTPKQKIDAVNEIDCRVAAHQGEPMPHAPKAEASLTAHPLCYKSSLNLHISVSIFSCVHPLKAKNSPRL